MADSALNQGTLNKYCPNCHSKCFIEVRTEGRRRIRKCPWCGREYFVLQDLKTED